MEDIALRAESSLMFKGSAFEKDSGRKRLCLSDSCVEEPNDCHALAPAGAVTDVLHIRNVCLSHPVALHGESAAVIGMQRSSAVTAVQGSAAGDLARMYCTGTKVIVQAAVDGPVNV